MSGAPASWPRTTSAWSYVGNGFLKTICLERGTGGFNLIGTSATTTAGGMDITIRYSSSSTSLETLKLGNIYNQASPSSAVRALLSNPFENMVSIGVLCQYPVTTYVADGLSGATCRVASVQLK